MAAFSFARAASSVSPLARAAPLGARLAGGVAGRGGVGPPAMALRPEIGDRTIRPLDARGPFRGDGLELPHPPLLPRGFERRQALLLQLLLAGLGQLRPNL